MNVYMPVMPVLRAGKLGALLTTHLQEGLWKDAILIKFHPKRFVTFGYHHRLNDTRVGVLLC